jgi:hypothetical protein
MTWLNEIVIESNDIRAMTIALMNTASQLSQMVTSLVLWPVTGKRSSNISKIRGICLTFSFFALQMLRNTILDLPPVYSLSYSIYFQSFALDNFKRWKTEIRVE